jgi:hypothetical protein
MRWSGHTAYIEEERNPNTVLVRNLRERDHSEIQAKMGG